MEIYNSQLVKEGANLEFDIVSSLATVPLMGYRIHLKECWPKLSRKVEIGFIKGTNGSELCFAHRLSFDNKDWLSFVKNGIALPAALENCRKGGIKKLIFYNKKIGFLEHDLEKILKK